MAITKKRFFKNTKKSIGNKSVNIREKQPLKQVTAQSMPKKMVREQEKPLLPKIPQIIAEKSQGFSRLFKGKSISYWSVMAGIIFIAMVSLLGLFVLGREVIQAYRVASNRQALEREMTLWEDISKKYPTYRDANFQVAVLAYRLGDIGKEREYLAKTLAIDPNFEPAKRLLE